MGAFVKIGEATAPKSFQTTPVIPLPSLADTAAQSARDAALPLRSAHH